MGALLSYSLFAGIFLAAGYMAYKALLSSEKQPGLNRAALLGIYALSLLALPLMSIDVHRSVVAVQEIELLPVAGIAVQSAAPAAPLWPRVALAVYLAGAAAVALWTVVALVRLATLLRAGRHERREGYTIVALNTDVVPFSFMHYIVMSETDAARADMVVTHELAHLRCRHWLDLLLAQAVCVLLWYNPASWLMRRELRRAHEYQADSAVLRSGADMRQYQMLLIEKAAGVRLQSLANSLDHSNLSKRITMMYKQNNRAARRLRALALVPALLVAAAATQIPAVASTLADASAATLQSLKPAEASAAPALAGRVASVQATDKDSKKSEASQAVKFPEYPGGMSELYKYLAYNVNYPADAMNAELQGRVAVAFTVAPDGSISDVNVVRSIAPSLDAEAVRVISAMPAWEPARDKAGKAVACSFTIPVEFKLQKDAPQKAAPKDAKTLDDVVVVGYASARKNTADTVKSSAEITIRTANDKNIVLKKNPAIFINNVRYDGDMEDIDPNNIKAITVKKDEPAYPDGAIYIEFK